MPSQIEIFQSYISNDSNLCLSFSENVFIYEEINDEFGWSPFDYQVLSIPFRYKIYSNILQAWYVRGLMSEQSNNFLSRLGIHAFVCRYCRFVNCDGCLLICGTTQNSRLQILTLAVRETGVSQNNGGPIKASPQTPSMIVFSCTRGFCGAFNWIPHDAERHLSLGHLSMIAVVLADMSKLKLHIQRMNNAT